MRVTLYNPPAFHYSGRPSSDLPVLGLASICRVLNAAGVDTQVIDLEAQRVRPAAFAAELMKSPPDMIGFTCLSVGAQGAKECIQAARAAGYTGRVMTGGVYASIHAEDMLAWGVDLVVVGECEGNIAELLHANGVQQGQPPEQIPLPDWDHYHPAVATFRGQYAHLHPRAGVSMWTRGCPYQCIYCSNLIYQRHPKRYRPPADIAAEMAYLKGLGLDKVYVYDDELAGSKQPAGWMSDVADRIAPLGMSWMVQCRCSERFITRELLADMKRAGCAVIQWGIESFSENVLRSINKHETQADIWHSLALAKEAGIKSSAFIMVGNYGETAEDCKITADALKRAYREKLLDHVQVFVAQIIEGTEYEHRAQTEGWYFEPRMKGLYMKKVTQGTPWLSAEEIGKFVDLYRRVCPLGAP